MAEVNHKSSHGKIVYLGIIVLLIVAIGGISWGLMMNNKAFSKSSLIAQNVIVDKTEVAADGLDFSQVTITIANQKENIVVPDIWTGLDVENDEQVTDGYSYFGWYSLEQNRAFYQTDQNGQVTFKIKSKIPGDIVYTIYIADPEQNGSGKYQSLDKSFTVSFK